MNYTSFFENYNQSIFNLLKNIDSNTFNLSLKLIQNVKKNNKKIYLAGNGASSSIADHISVDFLKAAKISSMTFNNSNLITCFSNDYGYDNWIKESIKSFYQNGDLIILISSSGKSKNIINAGKYCKDKQINLITLSGFSSKNPLKKLGNANFYIKSNKYNHIEIAHHIILVSIVDYFTKKLS